MEGSRQIPETVEVALLELGELFDCIPLGQPLLLPSAFPGTRFSALSVNPCKINPLPKMLMGNEHFAEHVTGEWTIWLHCTPQSEIESKSLSLDSSLPKSLSFLSLSWSSPLPSSPSSVSSTPLVSCLLLDSISRLSSFLQRAL